MKLSQCWSCASNRGQDTQKKEKNSPYWKPKETGASRQKGVLHLLNTLPSFRDDLPSFEGVIKRNKRHMFINLNESLKGSLFGYGNWIIFLPRFSGEGVGGEGREGGQGGMRRGGGKFYNVIIYTRFPYFLKKNISLADTTKSKKRKKKGKRRRREKR